MDQIALEKHEGSRVELKYCYKIKGYNMVENKEIKK